MFGLGNNPPSELSNELGRQAHSMCQMMYYIQVKKTLVPRPSDDSPVSLTDTASRNDVLKCFDGILIENNFLEAGEVTRRDKVNELALAVNQDTPQLYENTLTLLAALNWINFCFRCYYRDYPKSKKLFTLTNELAKICAPGIGLVFQDGLPEAYRKMWPYLSSIVEQNRAAYS